MPGKILVIEDEQRMLRILQLLLEDNGYTVKTAKNGIEGMKTWKDFDPHVVLTDIKMPQADGLQVLKFKNSNHLKAPLIILTAFGTIEKAVYAIKSGAFNYLTKPFKNADVIKVVKKAMLQTESGLSFKSVNHPIIGSSLAIRKILKNIAIVATGRTSVLITGESGTGKELVAKAIHVSGDRRQKKMVKVNCSAIPGDLLESELFGHVKGSFTGAVSHRSGSFQKADQGILFLDEIGDLPINLQPKLLHAVEDKTITPIGSSKSQKIDVKIISASNRNFSQMMGSGQFRSDLYFRLNAFNIHLPPLRQRLEDIHELSHFFMDYFSKEFKKTVTGISPEVIDLLKVHKWPGNIRELRNILESAVLTCQTGEINQKDLPETFIRILQDKTQTGKTGPDFGLDLEKKQKQLIFKALKKTGGNQVQAAKLLNISRNALRYRLKKYET